MKGWRSVAPDPSGIEVRFARIRRQGDHQTAIGMFDYSGKTPFAEYPL